MPKGKPKMPKTETQRTRSFLLWKLPYLARKIVMNQMRFVERLDLSMTSMKSKCIIMRDHKLPPATLKWDINEATDIYNYTYHHVTDLTINFLPPFHERPVLFGARDWLDNRPRVEKERRVNGTSIPLVADDCSFCVRQSLPLKTKLLYLGNMSKHFVDIIPIQSFDLDFMCIIQLHRFLKSFVFDITKKFGSISLNCVDRLMNPAPMKFLMESIQADRMVLIAKKITLLEDTIFTSRRLEMKGPVNIQNVIGIKCEKLHCRLGDLQAAEFFKILLIWGKADQPNQLKHFYLRGKFPENSIENFKDLVKESTVLELIVNEANTREMTIKRVLDGKEAFLEFFDRSFYIQVRQEEQ